jgi:hypothetical protein
MTLELPPAEVSFCMPSFAHRAYSSTRTLPLMAMGICEPPLATGMVPGETSALPDESWFFFGALPVLAE